jgi:hypothetical protein
MSGLLSRRPANASRPHGHESRASGKTRATGAKSCDHSTIPVPAQHTPRFDLQDEHFGSRKAWGAYINLSTVVHRQTVAQVDEFLAQLRARIERAMRRDS